MVLERLPGLPPQALQAIPSFLGGNDESGTESPKEMTHIGVHSVTHLQIPGWTVLHPHLRWKSGVWGWPLKLPGEPGATSLWWRHVLLFLRPLRPSDLPASFYGSSSLFPDPTSTTNVIDLWSRIVNRRT